MWKLFVRFVRDDDGQDMIEYCLLAAFISVVAYLIIAAIGADVVLIYTEVESATTAAAAAVPAPAP